MSEFDEIALDLCAEHGISAVYANDLADIMATTDMNAEQAIIELLDRFGDDIYD